MDNLSTHSWVKLGVSGYVKTQVFYKSWLHVEWECSKCGRRINEAYDYRHNTSPSGWVLPTTCDEDLIKSIMDE